METVSTTVTVVHVYKQTHEKNGRNTIGASFFSAAYHGFLFESFLGGLGGC